MTVLFNFYQISKFSKKLILNKIFRELFVKKSLLLIFIPHILNEIQGYLIRLKFLSISLISTDIKGSHRSAERIS